MVRYRSKQYPVYSTDRVRGCATHPTVNYTKFQKQRVGCVRYARTRLLD